MTHRLLYFVAVLALVLGPVTAGRAAAAGPYIWQGDQEEGNLRDWWYPEPEGVERNHCGGEYNSDGGESVASADRAHTGAYSAKMYINGAMTGSASSGTRLFRWCEAQNLAMGGAYYYSSWYYLPHRITVNNWWSLMQWKSAGSFNPKFMLGVYNRPDGQMYVYLGRGQDSGGGSWSQTLKNIPVGRWFHLEAYYKKATDSTGRVTVYQDGAQIIDATGVQTANSGDLSWSVISYGSDLYNNALANRNITTYIDDAAISTRREPVTVYSDSFTRTVSSGWGTSNSGHTYTYDGTLANFYTNGSTGFQKVTAGNQWYESAVNNLSYQNVRASMRFSTSKVFAGASGQVNLHARRVDWGTYYVLTVDLLTDQTMQISISGRVSGGASRIIAGRYIVPSLIHAANTSYSAKLEAEGANPTTLRAKIWKTSEPEPAGWQLTAQDSTVGLQTRGVMTVSSWTHGTVTTSMPILYGFDDLALLNLTP